MYKKYAAINKSAGTVTIDNAGMPDWAYTNDLLGNLLLKHKLGVGEHISQASLNGGNIACYYEDRWYAYIILPRLDKSNYTFTYSVGTSEMPNYVLNNGTYNVDKFEVLTYNAIV